MWEKPCVMCGELLGNSVCGSDIGILHPLCYYKREAERPRDEIVTQLRTQLRRVSAGIREQKPCVICQWPRPHDNEHNICDCCGFQEGYDDAAHYLWDGEWWSHPDRPPLIVQRLQEALAEATSVDARPTTVTEGTVIGSATKTASADTKGSAR
jgi:hypothetical protein